jgi:hypothetical protein
MLAMADADGCVRASIPGLTKRAGVTRNECEEALRILSSPDPDSKSKEEDGRRVREVDGGWLIINHRKYRDLRTETQIATAERVKRHRDKKKGGNVTVTNVTPVTSRNGVKRPVRAEEEEEEDKRTTGVKATEKPSPFPKSVCDDLYEAWTSVHGAINYALFRKTLAPLFPASGPRIPQQQLVEAIKAHGEYFEGLAPREAGFETIHKFAADVQRWVRIGAMPAIDPETREPTERGRLALA